MPTEKDIPEENKKVLYKIVNDMLGVPNCICNYPHEIYRNGSGHHPDCPCHKAWLKEFNEKYRGNK